MAGALRGGRANVTVYCGETAQDWRATLARHRAPAYVVGFAYIGDPRVWLSPTICAGVREADAWAVLVFIHEVIHTSGVRNERRANCLALAAERSFLQTFLGLTPEQAESVYQDSRARAMAEPPRYRPTGC